MPNPSAVFCEDQGYRYEIRTAADGSQSGVCIFADGSECDGWAYFRGECGPAQAEATPAKPPLGTGRLWLDKTEFQPGEEIQVHFETSVVFPGNAWVGIIPTDVPHGSETRNDEYDLDYQWLDGQRQSGVLTFVAPNVPGPYDFRLHDSDSDGWEVASVTFTVLGGPEQAALWLDKTTFAPGEEILVHFAALATFPSGAWVGIIPSDVPHGSEAVNDESDLDYAYLEGELTGVLSFLAPVQPGAYDFRLHDTDSDGQEVAYVSFTVSGGSAQPELWLDKTTFAPGEEIQVHFATPAGYPTDSWVGIIPSDVRHGSEAVNDENDLDYAYLEGSVEGVLSFLAPMEPGSYDFRLHNTDGDGQEVASVTFQVSAE